MQALTIPSYETINVAGPQPVNVKEIATIAGDLLDHEPRFEYADEPYSWNLVADIAKMKKTFVLSDLATVSQGIRRMVEAEGLRV